MCKRLSLIMTKEINEFFSIFELECKKVNISKEKIEKTKTYLEPILKKSKIIEWFFVFGPFPPNYPEIILDCFILTNKFLYDCEFKGKEPSEPLIHMISLREIINIDESVEKNIIIATAHASSLGGINIIDSLKNRDNLEKFVNQIRSQLIEQES